MKFYRYLIYKLYNLSLKKNSDTPIANVLLTLTFVHFVQLFSLYLILLRIFPQVNIFKKVDGIYIGLALIVIGIIHYFLIYSKIRWAKYIEEFKNEDSSKIKRGNKIVIAYLIGSIFLFFLLLPLLYGF